MENKNDMKTKLELKHLAPYLPYNLQCVGYGMKIRLNAHMLQKVDSLIVKPILKPLSDLINDDLRKSMDMVGHSSHIDWTTNERESIIKGRGHQAWMKDIPFAIIQYLFENHFDVFGLIPEGLAIDINTLN